MKKPGWFATEYVADAKLGVKTVVGDYFVAMKSAGKTHIILDGVQGLATGDEGYQD